MTELTVKQLADVVGISVDRLLAQLQEAGVDVNTADSSITEQQKLDLLSHLRKAHGKKTGEGVAEPKKITLKRKLVSEIRQTGDRGKVKTVSVEVRKKRTYIKRSAVLDEERQRAEADAEAEAEAVKAVPAEEERVVEQPEVDKQSKIDEERIAAQQDLERQNQAEEEARQLAEQEALQQAEQEARQQAEEEARRQAEEETQKARSMRKQRLPPRRKAGHPRRKKRKRHAATTGKAASVARNSMWPKARAAAARRRVVRAFPVSPPHRPMGSNAQPLLSFVRSRFPKPSR